MRGELDLLDGTPRTALADQLGLIVVVDRLGERVVAQAPNGSG